MQHLRRNAQTIATRVLGAMTPGNDRVTRAERPDFEQRLLTRVELSGLDVT